jgi:hypothetical protein
MCSRPSRSNRERCIFDKLMKEADGRLFSARPVGEDSTNGWKGRKINYANFVNKPKLPNRCGTELAGHLTYLGSIEELSPFGLALRL